MELLVVDANELFSSVISEGRGRQTKKAEVLLSGKFSLVAPDMLFEELEDNLSEIKNKIGISDIEFERVVELVKSRIEPVPDSEYLHRLVEAKDICPHEKDIPYFAVALKLNCAVWSGDKRLKGQSRVKVFNTKDLIDKFGL